MITNFWLTRRRRRQAELTAQALAEHTDAITAATIARAVDRIEGRAESHRLDAQTLKVGSAKRDFHTAVAHELLDAARDLGADS